MDFETLRLINVMLTPVSLGLSMFLLYFGAKAWKRNRKTKNAVVAASLLGVGLVFFAQSFLLLATYAQLFLRNEEAIHMTNAIRILAVNALTIITSIILILIYRDKV